MSYKHLFKASLTWNHPEQTSAVGSKIYNKSHHIKIEGKADLHISAAKAFKGDPALYNPEDLLLSSLISCHMMSYLYVCSQNGIQVLSYIDNAVATLTTEIDGSGRFTEVTLYPEILITDESQIELALALHAQANKLCFIANSCNFTVQHHPRCQAI
ncbi:MULTISPECIES: OsmC family protein [unclassified Sphingobacterium]|uniref:OsmC family protein n=1 Tax=unclassified Sphingobacterium TaxID=2609468 RepID=UPI0025D22C9C|nr:OsmC family protein [Sphingobacterium sp. UBA5670]